MKEYEEMRALILDAVARWGDKAYQDGYKAGHWAKDQEYESKPKPPRPTDSAVTDNSPRSGKTEPEAPAEQGIRPAVPRQGRGTIYKGEVLLIHLPNGKVKRCYGPCDWTMAIRD